MSFFKAFMLVANLVIMGMMYESIMGVFAQEKQQLVNDTDLMHAVVNQNEKDRRDRAFISSQIENNQKMVAEILRKIDALQNQGADQLSRN